MKSHPLCIMVVDDEKVVLTAMRYLLESAGIRAVTFGDARSALSAFQADPTQFDGIVTDLAMPSMSGAELADQVSRLRPGFPVTILSGFLDDDRLGGVSTREAVRTLSKPASLSEILVAFKSLGLRIPPKGLAA
ncbi:MAG: response regulator [Myxococcota bacterium]